MKDFKQQTVSVYLTWDQEPLGDLIDRLLEAGSTMRECTVRWDEYELMVTGWVPMTVKEKEAAAKRRAASRAANAAKKAKKEAEEAALYARLKEKFEP